MQEFLWQSGYLMGDAELDQQHQALFALANRLAIAVNQAELVLHAMTLYQYLRQHFKTEENYLLINGYPDLAEHQRHHQQMLINLNSLSEKINRGDWQQADLYELMQDWINHIVTEDLAVTDYLRSNDTSLSLALDDHIWTFDADNND